LLKNQHIYSGSQLEKRDLIKNLGQLAALDLLLLHEDQQKDSTTLMQHEIDE